MQTTRTPHNTRTWNRSRRGVSLIELVGTFLILAFVTLGTIQLYRVGDKTQRSARFYSENQTISREALRRMLRTLRHGYAVQTADTTWGGTETSDTNSQIIVTAPQPSASGTDHIRFYKSGTTLYAQNGTATAESIATGVTSVTFAYYRTMVTGSTGTATRYSLPQTISGTAYTIANATEVEITLTLTNGNVTTTETAYVELRNSQLGF